MLTSLTIKLSFTVILCVSIPTMDSVIFSIEK